MLACLCRVEIWVCHGESEREQLCLRTQTSWARADGQSRPAGPSRDLPLRGGGCWVLTWAHLGMGQGRCGLAGNINGVCT